MSTPIDSLELQIKSSSTEAVKGLDALSASLNKLKLATSGGLGLSSVTKQLNGLSKAVNSLNTSSLSKIDGFARALRNLQGIGNIKISASIGNQIKNISSALANLNVGDSASKITQLVGALKPLETLGKNNFGSIVNSLKKLPDVFKTLQSIDVGAFSSKIRELATALKPLADEMQKVSNGFAAFPSRIQKLIAENERLFNSNNKTGTSYINLWAKMRMAYTGIKTAARIIGSCIKKMNEYIENVNLFNVSMGEYAKEAGEYAEKVGEVMGIDPGEWMRNQGMFMTLATGFGIVSDRAYIMSKNLTQLGYDLSSFFNISYEDAMAKLQSGIAGELEPLRRIGYDLSQARLQQEAYTLGINKKLSAMTQAEKAELRYYAIMNQVTMAQGDMARTLSAPSNQLRILSAQFTQAGRAIGSIFIPMLNAILPYAIAAAKVIRILASAIASLFGFTLPDVDYSGIGASIGGAADAAGDLGSGLGDAADNAKKLQKYTMGFDELNVIDPTSADGSSGGGGGGVGGGGGGFDFELPEYDFISNAVSSEIDKIMAKIEPGINFIRDNMDDILRIVGAIGTAIITWKLYDIGESVAKTIKGFMENGEFNKVKMGITMMVSGITLAVASGYDIGKDGASLGNVLTTLIGDALIIGGSLLTFGTGPAGWIIGIAAAVVVTIGSIAWGAWDKAKEDDLNERFGDIVLSDDQIADWASQLTTSDVKVKLNLYLNEEEILKQTKTQLESAITTLDGYNFKIQCGIDVSQSEYETAIDSFITSAESYLEQKRITAGVALNILFGDEDSRGYDDVLEEFSNEFYTAQSAKLSELGKKLRNVVSQGFMNGEWIPDKLKEAMDLQKEIQEVLSYVAKTEFDAKITALKLDAADTEITAESFTKLTQQASDLVQKSVEDLEAVRLEGIKIAKMKYDQDLLEGWSKHAADEMYEKAVAEVESKFRQGKVELIYGTFDFGIDVITSKYQAEMDLATPIFQNSLEDALKDSLQGVALEDSWMGDSIGLITSELQAEYTQQLGQLDISSAAKKNIEELVESLKPTEDQLNDLAAKAREAGESVPKEVSEGLRNINQLKALSGDAEAIAYMIGDKLSNDPVFYEMLENSEIAGMEVNEHVAKGLLNNLDVVEKNSEGTIELINDKMGKKVLNISPELTKKLHGLGVNLSEGLLKGAEIQIENDKSSWKNWAWLPWNWFKDENEIHSPSKVFERGGSYIAQGLFNGVDKNTKQSDYDGVWSRLGKWFNNLLGISGDKSSVFDKLGNSVAKGLFGGVDSNVKKADYDGVWGRLKTWATSLFGIENNSSTVFDDMGGSISTGMYNGINKGVVKSDYETIFSRISSALSSVSGTISNIASSIVSAIERMVNGVITRINGAITSMNKLQYTVPSWVPVIGGNKYGVNIPLLPYVKFADGGFPQTGQMFVAREAGPELVGNIGRRSAVANNDQIVEGIAHGVSTANRESDALLREQNTLLKALLEKESGVYLDGRKISKNVEKHQRERGRVLVTGGAY